MIRGKVTERKLELLRDRYGNDISEILKAGDELVISRKYDNLLCFVKAMPQADGSVNYEMGGIGTNYPVTRVQFNKCATYDSVKLVFSQYISHAKSA